MAVGDVVFFEQWYVDVQEKFHDLETDAIKVGLITSVVTPTAVIADPRWGAGGTTNFATTEVTAGGNYSAGGPLAANPTITLTSNKGVFDADDISISQNPGNPTDARWAIIYNSTDAGLRAIGFVDLGTTIDLTAGDFGITWNASGISTLGAAA